MHTQGDLNTFSTLTSELGFDTAAVSEVSGSASGFFETLYRLWCS
jgi:hypothetical protein